MSDSIPVILHPAAVKPEDVDSYGQVPIQSEAGLDVCRDPVAGAFIGLCGLPGMYTANGGSRLGYLAMQKRTAGVVGTTPSSKVRLLTADHPDGG